MFKLNILTNAKLYAALCCLLLSACSTTLDTRITTFKDPNAGSQRGRVAILPFNQDKEGSLEFSYFAGPLGKRLEDLGFLVVDDLGSADYLLDLDYGVNRRQAEDRNSDTVFISSGFGSWRRGTSIGFVIDGDNDERFEYERVVQIRLRKNTRDAVPEGKKVASLVEVSAISVGRCELIMPIYPVMLDAIFKDFYRANGSTVKVRDKLPPDHCKTP